MQKLVFGSIIAFSKVSIRASYAKEALVPAEVA